MTENLQNLQQQKHECHEYYYFAFYLADKNIQMEVAEQLAEFVLFYYYFKGYHLHINFKFPVKLGSFNGRNS